MISSTDVKRAIGIDPESMPTEERNHPEYDLPTAVTFLLAGIALGAIVTLLFCPITNNSAAPTSALRPPAAPFPGERSR